VSPEDVRAGIDETGFHARTFVDEVDQSPGWRSRPSFTRGRARMACGFLGPPNGGLPGRREPAASVLASGRSCPRSMTISKHRRQEAIPTWVQAIAEGKEPVWTPLVCGVLALLGWLGPSLLGWPRWAEMLAFAGAYVAGGAFSLARAVRSLEDRRLDIDLLMLLSALGAASIGEYAEGATLLFLFSLSNALETRALHRTTRAIESLMELRPDEAMLLMPDGSERRVAAEVLEPGQMVRIRPGDRIPVDGQVVSGRTAADQAAITGESTPEPKNPGDRVFAGSINVGGTAEISVERRASESTLARIIELVGEAREAKAPTQRFIDRFEQGYAATVIFAAAVAVVLPVAFGEAFRPAFYRAMTLLVVASPCAVVISTPATILAALAHAARKGLLFKGGSPLEELASIDSIAFDKTGTLTGGRPVVTAVLPFGASSAPAVLAMAAAVERLSEHHLGRAIVESAEQKGLQLRSARSLVNHRGRGAVAEVAGQQVAVGRLDFVLEFGGQPPDARERKQIEVLEGEARTVVFVSGGGVSGALAIEDRVRPEARVAVKSLKDLGIERIVMMTGDNPTVAKRVAEAVAVDEWHAEVMPEEKVAILQGMMARGERVAMVGDGVNDAPALASATVGVAMGVAGTDAALETADLVLVRDELELLPYALRLSRKAQRIVRQNLAFACAVIAVLVVVNLLHGLALPIGVVGHEGSTIMVVLNGLRLLRPLDHG
jgi:Cd2+/Zn2+-exporting ATPase